MHYNITLAIIYSAFRHVCCCSAMETYFMKLRNTSVSELHKAHVALWSSTMLLLEAVWNPEMKTQQRRFLHASALCNVEFLHDLPLYGCPVAAPRCFCFTIIALTVHECRTRAESSWIDLQQKKKSFQYKPILVFHVCLDVAWLYNMNSIRRGVHILLARYLYTHITFM